MHLRTAGEPSSGPSSPWELRPPPLASFPWPCGLGKPRTGTEDSKSPAPIGPAWYPGIPASGTGRELPLERRACDSQGGADIGLIFPSLMVCNARDGKRRLLAAGWVGPRVYTLC